MDHVIWHQVIDLAARIGPPVAAGLGAGLGAPFLLRHLGWLGGPGSEAGAGADTAALLAEPRELVFRDGYLVDHTEGVELLLPGSSRGPDRLAAWDIVRTRLGRLVPGAGPALDALAREGRPFRLEAMLGGDRLVALGVRSGAELRITLAAAEAQRPAVRVPLATLRAMEEDARLLLGAVSGSPALSWAVDAEGRVVWGNAAYLDTLRRAQGPGAVAGWPLPALFPDDTARRAGTWRRSVVLDTQEAWYEITATEGTGWADLSRDLTPDAGAAPEGRARRPGGERIRFLHAQPIDRVIEAEGRLRRFIQSLSGAFAELPGGLAVFDPDDRLILFNPAFGDVTGLSPSWMAGRPGRDAVCRALADRLRLPGDAFAHVGATPEVEGARAGPDRESTNLELIDGRTLRLNWRRRPDGCLVLRLDDLTRERQAARADARKVLTATRRRAALEQETARALAEESDAAMVVFSEDGEQILATRAMQELWGVGPARPAAKDPGPGAPSSLEGWVSLWAERGGPDPAWGRLRDAGVAGHPREGWESDTMLPDGRPLRLRVRPLTGGRLAITFRPGAAPFLAAQPQPRPGLGRPRIHVRRLAPGIGAGVADDGRSGLAAGLIPALDPSRPFRPEPS
jgi:PAS domain-containing protein